MISVLRISISQQQINVYDGMAGSKNNAKVYFYGPAILICMATAWQSADFYIGGRFNLKEGIDFNAGKLTVLNSGTFNMSDEKKNTVNVDSMEISGKISMDIGIEETGTDSNDIIISSGIITINDSSEIFLNLVTRRVDEVTFNLIQYGELDPDSKFGSITYNALLESVRKKFSYGNADNKWISITINGIGKATDFGSIYGLSRNQQATANTLDKLSLIVDTGSDLDIVINKIDTMSVEAAGERKVKEALTQASGHFLANVVRSGAIENKAMKYMTVYLIVTAMTIQAAVSGHKLKGILLQIRETKNHLKL